MKKRTILLTALTLTLFAFPAFCAPLLRVYVADMSAVGVQNRDEMKLILQTLLASRLNSDKIVAVGSAAEADISISGSYISIGKVFSVDALAKTAGGTMVARSFVQGDSQDELIPAISKLAEKLTAELIYLNLATRASTVTLQQSTAARPATATPDIIKNESAIRQAPTGDIVRPISYENTTAGAWVSKRLEVAANLMAIGKTLSDGSREIFLAEDRRLVYFHQGSGMKQIAEVKFGNSEKILSLDTMEGKDGTLDLYVTILRSEEPASQVWQVKGDKLIKVADKLPWFFRSLRLAGGVKKLYAQGMGREADFYGDVYEATRNGAVLAINNPLKMPRFGDIYSFNQFRAKDGVDYTVAINPDGYLIVYDLRQKELWRSNDRFGGSELYFLKENQESERVTGDKYRWIFMNQRVQVSSSGDLLVGKNDGFWVLGNARTYKRGAVYCLTWNGSSLEEKWRTRDTQNYMPDYVFDESRNELLLLQTVQRASVVAQGASSLSIKKVE